VYEDYRLRKEANRNWGFKDISSDTIVYSRKDCVVAADCAYWKFPQNKQLASNARHAKSLRARIGAARPLRHKCHPYNRYETPPSAVGLQWCALHDFSPVTFGPSRCDV